jgi:hypothetical protein
MTRQSNFRNVAPALVVGIGYPSDEVPVVNTERWLDLTPTVSPDPAEKRPTGGADVFLRVIDEEIKPFVASRYKVEAANQALWGHSIGGLTVLRALFRRPDSFSTFLISSPSIWWDSQLVLKDETAFTRRMAESGPQLRVLITSAGEEQYRGDDPKLRANAEKFRMIDNASELADRLGKAGDRISTKRYVLEGETHISVSHGALTRSLRFSFPPPASGVGR